MTDLTGGPAGSPAVVMLMRGCGGDITDPACPSSSLITRPVFTDNYIICPVARAGRSEEADTEPARFIIRNNYRLEEERRKRNQPGPVRK